MNKLGTTVKQVTKGDKTYQLILDAAAKAFSKQGYHGTPLKEVADSIGMKTGSLYYHFPSKEVLMQAVLNKSIQLIYATVRKEVDQLDDNARFADVLKAAIRGHLIAILSYADYTSASIRNYGQIPIAVHQASQNTRDEYEQFWRSLFNSAQAEGVIRADVDKNLLRLAIFGSMNWASVWYEKGGQSVDKIAESQADFFLNGCLKGQ